MYHKKGSIYMTGLVYPSTGKSCYKQTTPAIWKTEAAARVCLTYEVMTRCVKPLTRSVGHMSRDITRSVVKGLQESALQEEG